MSRRTEKWAIRILLECFLVARNFSCQLRAIVCGDSKNFFERIIHYYRPKRSFGQGNIFTPVCHSVHRGGRVLLASPPPPGMETPLEQTPARMENPPQMEEPPPDGEPPRMEEPPRIEEPPPDGEPPPEADSGIRSAIGRYASYWNAFLFQLNFRTFIRCKVRINCIKQSF